MKHTLGLLHGCVEEVRLDVIERLALLNEVALLEQDGFEVAGDARPHLDPLDGLDAPDEVLCLRYRLLLRNYCRDGHCLLGVGGSGKQQGRQEAKLKAHLGTLLLIASSYRFATRRPETRECNYNGSNMRASS